MPIPMPIDLSRDLGVKRLRYAMYVYLGTGRALALLDKALDFIESVSRRGRGAGERLWTDPLEAYRRLLRLRRHLAELELCITDPAPPRPLLHEPKKAFLTSTVNEA